MSHLPKATAFPIALVLVAACGGGGSTASTGSGGANTSSTGTTQATSGTATGPATSTGTATGPGATTGSATTTSGTSTSTTTSTGTGMSCMLHTSACGMCVATSCQAQYAACHANTPCKNATSPGGSLDTCLCNAEAAMMPTGTCFTSFDAMGQIEKSLGDCVQAMCKTPCGL